MTVRTTRRAVLLGVTGALATPSILRAQSPQVRLTLGHGAAPGNPRSVAADRMAALLRERSNGRIEMRVAGSAQLGDDAAMLTALRTGTLDMSVNSQGASSAVLPELAALGLPFLFPNAAAAYKVVDGPIGQELAKRLDGVGLTALGFWDNGIRHVTNAKRPINRPEDLRGLKIRTPPDPMTIDIFQALGAATQQINFGELYVALQQGVVDGQENPLANIHSSKLHRGEPLHLAHRPSVAVQPRPRVPGGVGTAQARGPAPRARGGEGGRGSAAHALAGGRHPAPGRVPGKLCRRRRTRSIRRRSGPRRRRWPRSGRPVPSAISSSGCALRRRLDVERPFHTARAAPWRLRASAGHALAVRVSCSDVLSLGRIA